jgi:hypothetical protein
MGDGAMMKRLVFAATVAIAAGTAQAEHAVAPEGELVPAVTREICDVAEWGYDQVRTDCRVQVRPAPKANPALSGICTIYYGRRTCH